jgi:predicted metalloprotease with PDZ domain
MDEGGSIMTHAKWMLVALLAALVFLALVALPVVAGEKGHKCTASAQDCLNKMVQTMKTRGWVGIEMDDSKTDKTVSIKRVVPGSPAEAAGFQVGDVLVSINGAKFADNTEEKCATCEATKENWVPGKKVHYVVSRYGREVQVEPTLASVPSDVMAQWIGSHMIEHAEVQVAQK